MSKAFVHSELPLPIHRFFRLLRLDAPPVDEQHVVSCSLETFELDDCPSYYALSYTRGNPFDRATPNEAYDAMYSIQINSKSYDVTKNLPEALLELRKSYAHSYIWIDAICIWQANLQERKVQVVIMDELYENATSMLIWLGISDAETGSVVQLITQIASLPPIMILIMQARLQMDFARSDALGDASQICGLPAHGSPVWRSLNAFFSRSYFQRVWILQENVFAKDAHVYCGAFSFPGKILWAASNFLVTTNLGSVVRGVNQYSEGTTELEYVGLSAAGIDLMRGICHSGSHSMSTDGSNIINKSSEAKLNVANLVQILILMTRPFEATDPRDRMYALLSIVKKAVDVRGLQPFPMTADYTRSAQDIFRHLTTLIFKNTGWLEYLAYVQGKSLQRLPDLPSWVKDLTAGALQPLMCTMDSPPFMPDFDAGKVFQSKEPGFEIDGRHLHVKARYLDTVSDLGDTVSDMTKLSMFDNVAKLILRCPPIYKTGQDRIEVLWRTLLSDQSPRYCPLPPEFGRSFSAWLRYLLARDMFSAETQAQDLILLTNARPNVDILAQADQTRLFSGYKQVCDEIAACVSPTVNDKAAAYTYTKKLAGEMMLFLEALGHVAVGRRIFRTENGWLGLGPRSLEIGDSVWILAAARTPYALQKLSDGNQDAYELVGEVYVHGAMHGEALGDGVPMWDDIVLHRNIRRQCN